MKRRKIQCRDICYEKRKRQEIKSQKKKKDRARQTLMYHGVYTSLKGNSMEASSHMRGKTFFRDPRKKTKYKRDKESKKEIQ